MKKVLLIGAVDYSVDNAAMLRVLEVRKVLLEMGCEVEIHSSYALPPTRVEEIRRGEGKFASSTNSGGLVERTCTKLGYGFRSYFHYRKQTRVRYEYVYCYGSELSWVLSAVLLARCHKAHLVFDVTELHDTQGMWESFSTFRSRVGGWLGLFLLVPLFGRTVFVPSRSAMRLHQRLHANVVLLPPFFTELQPNDTVAEPTGLQITYAGSPGTKENINVVLEALRLLPEDPEKPICFNLVGIDARQLEHLIRRFNCAALLARRDIVLHPHGRLPVDEARQIVARSDYIILVRKNSARIRYGFPSKVSEALGLGVPIVSNLFSDLEYYQSKGHIGLLAARPDPRELQACIAAARALSRAERESSRAAALAAAREFFSMQTALTVLGPVFTNPDLRTAKSC